VFREQPTRTRVARLCTIAHSPKSAGDASGLNCHAWSSGGKAFGPYPLPALDLDGLFDQPTDNTNPAF
jgi:hypothetical protein